ASADFPTTSGAFQAASGGAFVAKLNATGTSLVYSTYLGNGEVFGLGFNEVIAIAVDGSGNAYVTGNTSSTNFPTTPGAFQPTSSGGQQAFVTKLNASGSGLVYSTYLGGAGGGPGERFNFGTSIA